MNNTQSLTTEQRIAIIADYNAEKIKEIKELLKIKVVHVETYRDGGTVVYEDIYNRRYFQWWPTKKFYNQMPFPRGGIGCDTPPEYVKELTCEIEIVEKL